MADGLLRIEHMPLEKLLERKWPGNPKDHDLEAIKESIQRFGFLMPGLWDEGTERVVVGHGRGDALAELRDAGAEPPDRIERENGDWLVPVIRGLEFDDREEAEAYLLADNRLTELGGWNDEALAEMFDARLEGESETIGWSEDEIRELMDRALPEDLEEEGGPEPDMDEAERMREDLDVQAGQLWRIGRHRLLVGDATNQRHVAALFGSQMADLLVTDPPYGVDYVGKTEDALTISGDNLGHEGTRRLVRDVLRSAPLKQGGVFYLFSPAGDLETIFRLAVEEAGLSLRQCIVWLKDHFVMGRQDYHWRHESILYGISPAPLITTGWRRWEESILYGWKEGDSHFFIDDRTQDTVWEFDRPAASREHPTMKPVGLIVRAIRNSSRVGELVYDACLGSGSTMIAAHKARRTCYGMELEPKYAAVTLQRMAALDLEPELERTIE